MKIRDLMTEKNRLETVSVVAFLPEVAQKMKTGDTGVIPVVDEQNQDRIVGLITDRDIAIRAVAEGIDIKNAKVQDFMSTDLNCVSPDIDSDEASRLMSEKQLHRLCVVENDRLVGMLALGDLAVTENDTARQALEGISQGAKAEK